MVCVARDVRLHVIRGILAGLSLGGQVSRSASGRKILTDFTLTTASLEGKSALIIRKMMPIAAT